MSLVLLLGQYKVLVDERGHSCQIKWDILFARLSWTFFLTHCPGYIVIYLVLTDQGAELENRILFMLDWCPAGAGIHK